MRHTKFENERYVVRLPDEDATKSSIYLDASSSFIHKVQVSKEDDKVELDFDAAGNPTVYVTLTDEMAYELAQAILATLKVK